MRKGTLCVLVVMAVYLLSGCALAYKSNSEKAIATAKNEDFGVLPDNYKEQIQEFMCTVLKDPDSAKYMNWEAPYKDTTPQGDMDPTAILCWKVWVHVNAKNSFGGYTGSSRYGFFFVNGKIYAFGEYQKRINFVNQ